MAKAALTKPLTKTELLLRLGWYRIDDRGQETIVQPVRLK